MPRVMPRNITLKRAPKKPTPKPRNATLKGAIRDSNSILLASPETTVTNTVYPFTAVNIPLNVAGLQNAGATRLAEFLSLYDEFKFSRIHLRWESALPSTTTGQVAMYYDPDPTAETPTEFAGVSGNYYLRVGHAAKPLKYSVPARLQTQARLNWFTRKKNDEQGTQGAIVLVFSPGTVPHASGNIVLGSLWLDYTVFVRSPTPPSKVVRASYAVAPTYETMVRSDTNYVASKVAAIYEPAGPNILVRDVNPRLFDNGSLVEEVERLRAEMRELSTFISSLQNEISRVREEEDDQLNLLDLQPSLI